MGKIKEHLIELMDGSNMDDSDYEQWLENQKINEPEDPEDNWYNQTSEES